MQHSFCAKIHHCEFRGNIYPKFLQALKQCLVMIVFRHSLSLILRSLVVLCLLICLCSFSSIAETDSLHRALLSARHDTIRVQLLNKLSNELRTRNSDSALMYAYEALRIAETANYKHVWGYR